MTTNRLRAQDNNVLTAIRSLREQIELEAGHHAEEFMALATALRDINNQLFQQLEECKIEHERSKVELAAAISKYTKALSQAAEQNVTAINYVADRLYYRENDVNH
jgi:DNA polymerase III delta prime subunit